MANTRFNADEVVLISVKGELTAALQRWMLGESIIHLLPFASCGPDYVNGCFKTEDAEKIRAWLMEHGAEEVTHREIHKRVDDGD